MTFSAILKKDLSRSPFGQTESLQAELSGLIAAIGVIRLRPHLYLSLKTENPPVAARIYRLLKALFAFKPAIHIDKSQRFKKHRFYQIEVADAILVEEILIELKILKISQGRRFFANLMPTAFVQKNKRAYLRGVFLGCGSIANPEKGYHLEFVGKKAADQGKGPDFQAFFQSLMPALAAFEIRSKLIDRESTWVLYIKEGESLINFLNVIGAHKELLQIENIRILKGMRSAVNRQVNCETANLNKTIVAATDQINDILYLKEHYGLERLSQNLYDMAEVRLNYPDDSIKELGQRLDPPVGKSGVYHRLSKLRGMAKNLRMGKE